MDARWLDALNNCILSKPKSHIYQPKILSARQPTHFEYAGAAGGYIDRYGYPYCRGRIFDIVEEDTGQYDENVALDWASELRLLKKHCLRSSVDLTKILKCTWKKLTYAGETRQNGHKISFCHSSVVYHIGGLLSSRIVPKDGTILETIGIC